MRNAPVRYRPRAFLSRGVLATAAPDPLEAITESLEKRLVGNLDFLNRPSHRIYEGVAARTRKTPSTKQRLDTVFPTLATVFHKKLSLPSVGYIVLQINDKVNQQEVASAIGILPAFSPRRRAREARRDYLW